MAVDLFDNRFVLLLGHGDCGDAQEGMKNMIVGNLSVMQHGDATFEGINVLHVPISEQPFRKIILILGNLNNTSGLTELLGELLGAPWLCESWEVILKNVNTSTCQNNESWEVNLKNVTQAHVRTYAYPTTCVCVRLCVCACLRVSRSLSMSFFVFVFSLCMCVSLSGVDEGQVGKVVYLRRDRHGGRARRRKGAGMMLCCIISVGHAAHDDRSKTSLRVSILIRRRGGVQIAVAALLASSG